VKVQGGVLALAHKGLTFQWIVALESAVMGLKRAFCEVFPAQHLHREISAGHPFDIAWKFNVPLSLWDKPTSLTC
jgi:hypothetical protein